MNQAIAWADKNLHITQPDSLSPRSLGDEGRTNSCVFLYALSSEDYRLLPGAIRLSVETDDDSYIITYEPLNIYTWDADIHNAVKNIESQILDMYDELLNVKDTGLGRDMRRYKAHVATIIKKIA